MGLDQRQIDKMTECGIPDYMHGGLIRYFDSHIQPGHFLTAVLSNDLMEAFSRADLTNRDAMHGYTMWLYNYAPGRASGAWGSAKAVEEWINGSS